MDLEKDNFEDDNELSRLEDDEELAGETEEIVETEGPELAHLSVGLRLVRTLLGNQLSLAQAVNLQLIANIRLIKALGGGWGSA